MATAAVNSYADFEQLAGGIETLFGARGATSVEEYAQMVGQSVDDVKEEFDMLMEAQTLAMENANSAYKTAGLSANDYMETVTSLAASLKQSTENEVEAAKAADQAIIDMSDNANKMGTSMEAIQNAYQGFAKQNYTMLDNLKLGYGGTKTEMERLLADATKLSGIEYDIDNLADVYEAIHVIQTELGITGTTALEASTTIQGSTLAMKAAWDNLVVGIANDNADLDTLTDQFVDSAITTLENILPVAEVALNGSVALVTQLLTTIGPQVMDLAYNIVTNLLLGITERSSDVFNSGSDLLFELIWGITDKIPDLMSMMVDAIIALALAITEPNVLANIISAGIELIVSLVTGLIDAIPKLLEAAPKLIAQLVAGLIASLPQLSSAALSIIMKLASGLLESIGILLKFPKKLYEDFVTAFDNIDWGEIGLNMLRGLWRGIENGWSWLADSVRNLASNLFGVACEALGINSPSKKFKWIGEMCIEGIDEPFEDYNPYETLQNSMEANIGGLKATYASATAGMFGKGAMTYNQTVNVNQPVATPDELARTMRTESKFGLITGEVIPVG